MSHVRRVVHIRVLVVARSGPVRAATLGAFACDHGMSVVGQGATCAADALHEVERWRPDVVVVDATTVVDADALAEVARTYDLGPFERAPGIVVVGRARRIPTGGILVVQARHGGDEELLDFQGELIGAVWSAATQRVRGRASLPSGS